MKSRIVKDTYASKGDEIACGETIITYNQLDDFSSDQQEIKISTCDNGAGKYMVFSTERWAFDDIDELILVLKDFKKKAGIK